MMNFVQRNLTMFNRFKTAQHFRFFSCSQSRNGQNIGFIGLGNMGSHMAQNLVNAGHRVIAYDIVKSHLDTAVSGGALYTSVSEEDIIFTPCGSFFMCNHHQFQASDSSQMEDRIYLDCAEAASNPAEVASKSDSIITMLPSSPHVKACFTGDGILSTIKPGTLILDCSTIDPMVSKEMAEQAGAKGAVYMDAPVSGGIMGAKGATLTFMVGGPEESFADAKAILSLMGKNVVHCGAVSTGQAAKICNNMLLGITMIGVSETMNLGQRLGLDPKMLASILNTSSGRCWAGDTYNPCPGVLENVPSSNNYKDGFGTALMTKDLGLAQDAATTTNSPNPLGSSAHQLYRIMCNKGYGHLDFSSAYKFLQEQDKDGK